LFNTIYNTFLWLHQEASLVNTTIPGYSFLEPIHLTRSPNRNSRPAPLSLAGHLGLDFLNTRMRVKGKLVDLFQRDEDVLHWLKLAGLPVPKAGADVVRMSLLDCARTLRENIRSLVEKRKAGQRGDPLVLNRFLSGAQSHPQLVWNKPRSLKIEEIRGKGTAEAILGPVAEAAAELLATADFKLVKRCEDATCVLWFSDHTKSHHRRWCSMALCGNRHKVAAYRRRLRDRAR
jgi:predicted RNA-binding Zn ribbon-like protein